MPISKKVFGTAFLLAACLSGTAQAAACHDAAVSARGEPSRFVWIAKTKARANWRRKVRSISGLGADWAVWGNASETEERCLSGPEGTLCIFTGTPCKP